MPPAKDEHEAMQRLRGLLAMTPPRCYARQVLESTLPILDRDQEQRHDGAADNTHRDL
jgi:hypothetical protein